MQLYSQPFSLSTRTSKYLQIGYKFPQRLVDFSLFFSEDVVDCIVMQENIHGAKYHKPFTKIWAEGKAKIFF